MLNCVSDQGKWMSSISLTSGYKRGQQSIQCSDDCSDALVPQQQHCLHAAADLQKHAHCYVLLLALCALHTQVSLLEPLKAQFCKDSH